MIYENATPHALGYREADARAVHAAVGKIRVIDVREPAELAGELGHIPGVERVPLATLEAASATWDKGDEIALVCRSGARSGRAAALLVQRGFTRVVNMTGGMLAVQAAALPVAR